MHRIERVRVESLGFILRRRQWLPVVVIRYSSTGRDDDVAPARAS